MPAVWTISAGSRSTLIRPYRAISIVWLKVREHVDAVCCFLIRFVRIGCLVAIMVGYMVTILSRDLLVLHSVASFWLYFVAVLLLLLLFYIV